MADSPAPAPSVPSVAENVVIGGEKSEGLMSMLTGLFTKNKKTLIIGIAVVLLYMAFVRFSKAKGASTSTSSEHPKKEQVMNMANRQKHK